MRVSAVQVVLVLIVLGLTVLTAWSLRYFGRYQPFANLMQGSQNASSRIGLKIDQVTVAGRQRGRRRWRLSARTITLSRDRREVTVSGIHDGVLFDSGGRPAVSVSAGQAVLDTAWGVFSRPEGSSLRLSGGIRAVVQGPRPLVLETGSLAWNGLQNAASIPGRVIATYNGRVGPAPGPLRLEAGSLTWDGPRHLMRSGGPVTATFDGGQATITSEGVTLDVRTGDLSLQRLHGTFAVPAGVQ